MVLGREDPLEVLVGRRIDLLRVLSWLMVLREQLIRLGNQGRYPIESLAVHLVILSEGRALQVLNGEDQLVLAQMRALQDCVFVRLEAVKVLLLLLRGQLLRLVESRVASGEVTNRSDDVLLDVLDEGINERCADVFEAALDPHVVVKEVALACQNAEIDGEVVVLAVDDWDEAGAHFLGDVEYAGQVHKPLIVLAELADAPDEETVVGLEELLQHYRGVHMVAEEEREQDGEELVDEYVAH